MNSELEKADPEDAAHSYQSALRRLRCLAGCGRRRLAGLPFVKLDPRFDLICQEPRYTQIFEAMAHRVTALRDSKLAQINDWTNELRV